MVKIKKVIPWALVPVLGSSSAAAFDVRWTADIEIEYTEDIPAGGVVTFGTGLAFELPDDMAMLILPRSGLATKKHLRPANTPGLLDPDYRGELKIALENFGSKIQQITTGERIAQIMFVPVVRPEFEVVDELTPTVRGEGGFGSTGA